MGPAAKMHMLRPRSSRHRHRSLRRTLLAAALVVGAPLAIVAAVQAALPATGASFTFHDHAMAGKNWHIDFRIDPKNARKIATLVVYSQQCKGTVAKTGIPISDAGVIAASGGLEGDGLWEVNATFKAPTTLVGTMRVRRANCDTGALSFPNAITGDGHTGHSHGGGGHDHGPKDPDFESASPRQRRQASALHRGVLRTWRGVTVAKAERLGWVQNPTSTRQTLGMFHTYNRRYENDKRILDARRPESLVFWRPASGQPVILGPMFRVPAGRRPSFAGPIPIYHNHGDNVKNLMTHVWLVRGSKSAWMNCLPVRALEQYNPAFKWMPGGNDQGQVGDPC